MQKLSLVIFLSFDVACLSPPPTFSAGTGEEESITSTEKDTRENRLANCGALFAKDLEALQDLAEAATDWNPMLTAETACSEKNIACEVVEEQCRVVKLYLFNLGLETIPPSMNQLAKLRLLNLLNNDSLSSLPEGFGNGWPKLERLYLIGNSLDSLPEGFGSEWTHLKDLSLIDNNLGSLPERFGNEWTKLERLYLDNNSLSSLPEGFGNGWPNLRKLSLEVNRLGSLPEGFGNKWIHLKDLSLYNNSLRSLPEGFGNGWLNLKNLKLSANDLDNLPEGVGSGWTNLQVLDLGLNDLSSLPEGFGGGWTHLKDLSLEVNRLSSLPEGFGSEWMNLRKLSLYRNRLSSLPERFGSEWINLRILSLFNNSLSSLPEGFGNGWPNLRELTLHDNSLSSLPESFGAEWISLEYLYLSKNRLNSLPDTFGNGWADLQKVDLTGNQLKGELLETIPQKLLLKAVKDSNKLWLCLSYNGFNLGQNLGFRVFFADIVNSICSYRHSFKTFPQTQTLPPQVLKAENIQANSFTLSWQPQWLEPIPEPTHSWDTPVGGGYVITVEGLEAIVLEDVNQTSYQLTNLTPSTKYSISIQAFTNPHKYNPNKITSMLSPILEVRTAKL